jgi:hypothetical protein
MEINKITALLLLLEIIIILLLIKQYYQRIIYLFSLTVRLLSSANVQTSNLRSYHSTNKPTFIATLQGIFIVFQPLYSIFLHRKLH